MPNYQLGKIYKLTNGTLNYYGSTIRPLKIRLNSHKMLEHSSKVLFEGDNTVSIELLENYPCDTKQKLLERERWYIENNECVNNNIPGRTDKEWRDANKEYQKEYVIKNKEKIKERKSSKILCVCGNYYTYSCKGKHMKTKKHLNICANL
tara:strand:+ start:160 stop:609 length:450 start_codon:yes stop_codon:yes gene_type:complete